MKNIAINSIISVWNLCFNTSELMFLCIISPQNRPKLAIQMIKFQQESKIFQQMVSWGRSAPSPPLALALGKEREQNACSLLSILPHFEVLLQLHFLYCINFERQRKEIDFGCLGYEQGKLCTSVNPQQGS